MVKKPPVSTGDLRDMCSIPGSGRSPGEGRATHSSVLAWRIPWTEEPGELQSMWLQRVRHDRSDLAHNHTAHKLHMETTKANMYLLNCEKNIYVWRYSIVLESKKACDISESFCFLFTKLILKKVKYREARSRLRVENRLTHPFPSS